MVGQDAGHLEFKVWSAYLAGVADEIGNHGQLTSQPRDVNETACWRIDQDVGSRVGGKRNISAVDGLGLA